MKKAIDWRLRITTALMGIPSRGRPPERKTGTKPSKRSIPQAWRDLDDRCLEFALNELNAEALNELNAESFDEQFVNCAARRARIYERCGNYKIRKLGGKSTGPRRPRAHEQRVRRLAKALLWEADRVSLEPQAGT
jgi:hypothetical protein